MDTSRLLRSLKSPLRRLRYMFTWASEYRLLLPHQLILFLIAVPLAILQRAVAPVLLVRTSRISAERIGNLTLEIETYLADRDAGRLPEGCFDIFFYNKPISNLYIAERWKDYVRVWPLVRYLHLVNLLLYGGSRFVLDVSISPERVLRCADLLSGPRHLSVRKSDRERARRLLEQQGILPQGEYVCFFNRDSSYLQSHISNVSWSYHDYRDSSINNYLLAVEMLAARGISAYRLGAKVQECLQSENPRIVDYAGRFRALIGDDLLDVLLMEDAKYIVATTCGLYALGETLRKDSVTVNATPFITVGFPGRRNLYIPKVHRMVEGGKLIPFKEILSSQVWSFGRTEEYSSHGIELIENTPEEIRDVVAEMDARIAGQWQGEPGDAELHAKYNRLIADYIPKEMKPPRIGTAFLRKYSYLLN